MQNQSTTWDVQMISLFKKNDCSTGPAEQYWQVTVRDCESAQCQSL